jgi:segregation and condensation protein A
VFKLIEALDRALENARPELGHEVVAERLTIGDAISRVAEVLRTRRRVRFADLLSGGEGAWGVRSAIIATFLALLEMARLRLVRIYQAVPDEGGAEEEILVEAKENLGEGVGATTEDYR